MPGLDVYAHRQRRRLPILGRLRAGNVLRVKNQGLRTVPSGLLMPRRHHRHPVLGGDRMPARVHIRNPVRGQQLLPTTIGDINAMLVVCIGDSASKRVHVNHQYPMRPMPIPVVLLRRRGQPMQRLPSGGLRVNRVHSDQQQCVHQLRGGRVILPQRTDNGQMLSMQPGPV